MVEGTAGIGTTTPKNRLDVAGGAAIGSYAGVTAAPSDGLIVTGNVGIGTSSPNVALDVAGAFVLRGMAAPGLSLAGNGRIYFDAASNTFKVSENGGAYADIQTSGRATTTPVATKTAASTLTATDGTIYADATGGGFTLTLPSAVGIAGREYTVKRLNGGANVPTVAPINGQTIDGAATYALTAQYALVTVQSDGANWFILAKQ